MTNAKTKHLMGIILKVKIQNKAKNKLSNALFRYINYPLEASKSETQ